MTIRELLNKGKGLLSNSETAELDSEVLLAYALGVGKEYLFANIDVEVDNDTESLYLHYVEKVASGQPVAYVLREKEFFGIDFFVDERVLIPRPETELLVEKVLDFIRSHKGGGRKFRILDVGTGSGNIPVSIAKTLFDADEGELIRQIDAVDISEAALEVARVNVEQYGLGEVIHLYESDLLENVEEGESFDVIVANLPYIGEEKHSYVSDSTRRFEPGSALYAGSDGLELYKKMFQQIKDKNVSFKAVFGEFGFGQSNDLSEVLNKKFDQNFVIEKDLAGIDRIFVITN